jgi:hypothetical protein
VVVSGAKVDASGAVMVVSGASDVRGARAVTRGIWSGTVGYGVSLKSGVAGSVIVTGRMSTPRSDV